MTFNLSTKFLTYLNFIIWHSLTVYWKMWIDFYFNLCTGWACLLDDFKEIAELKLSAGWLLASVLGEPIAELSTASMSWTLYYDF